MESAMALGGVMGPVYLVLGLSLLLHPKSWGKLMDRYIKDHFELFPLMAAYLALGVVFVNMYNVWEWNIWLLITITGWGFLLKGLAYFLLPGDMLMSMWKKKNSSGLLMFGGLLLTAMGLALSYYVYLV